MTFEESRDNYLTSIGSKPSSSKQERKARKVFQFTPQSPVISHILYADDCLL